jgi:hypothetical protein
MRVFLVDGAIQNENVLESWLIPNGMARASKASCDSCIYDSHEEACSFLVQGFDDFETFDPMVTAFLPQTPPLISSEKHIEELAESLTGVVPVRVGFNEWEQSPVPPEDWFTIGPNLSALFVTSVCPLVYDEKGARMERCDQCGRQKIRWYIAEAHISEYRVSRKQWPETDVFLLEGGGQHRGVCVTESAVSKISILGFTNLKLVEMGWFVG